jgi:hypothetical protein
LQLYYLGTPHALEQHVGEAVPASSGRPLPTYAK